MKQTFILIITATIFFHAKKCENSEVIIEKK